MSGNESQLGFHPLYSRELLYFYARATVHFVKGCLGHTVNLMKKYQINLLDQHKYLVLFGVMERNRSHFESISL